MKKTKFALAIALMTTAGFANANYSGHNNNNSHAHFAGDTELTLSVGESRLGMHDSSVKDQKFDSYKVNIQHTYNSDYVSEAEGYRHDLKDAQGMELTVDRYRVGGGKKFALSGLHNTFFTAKAGAYHFEFDDKNDTGLYLEGGFETKLSKDVTFDALARHYVNNDNLGDFEASVSLGYQVSPAFELAVTAEHMIGKYNVEQNTVLIGGTFKF
jgi:hypothetical protein